MLKMPSPLRSYGSFGWGEPQSGTGSSPRLSQVLLLRSLIAPKSFHLIPESCTAITTSGRPVVVSHALSIEAPVTHFSSLGRLGSPCTSALQFSKNFWSEGAYSWQAFLELYFQISPPRSLGGNCLGSSAFVMNM